MSVLHETEDRFSGCWRQFLQALRTDRQHIAIELLDHLSQRLPPAK